MRMDLLRLVGLALLVTLIYVTSPLRTASGSTSAVWAALCGIVYVVLAVWLVLLVIVQQKAMRQPRVAQAHKKRRGE